MCCILGYLDQFYGDYLNDTKNEALQSLSVPHVLLLEIVV